MLNFDRTEHCILKAKLIAAGWSRNKKAKVTVAGQLHQWRQNRDSRGRTLRNACRIAGIAE